MPNLFAFLPSDSSREIIETLAKSDHVRIERIVSQGQSSPSGFWYDQPESEWVIVLQGAARLQFEGDPMSIDLNTGDHLLIPPRCRHRVEWTKPDELTIWLAVFFD